MKACACIFETMITFIVALVLLVVGFFTYGVLVERIFGVEPDRKTPALTKTDGVDFVPMAPWRIFLVQFLNIAGLGPIFGAIMGIYFGPAAFLWIVFGTIFAGGVHDYLSGMISIRKGGVSLPNIIGDELGKGFKIFMLVLSLVLLILLTTTFLSGPATLLQKMHAFSTLSWGKSSIPIVWVLIIFAYYALATVLPVDKLIGRFYPVFGAMLLFMGVGIMVIMLGWHSSDMPEVFDGLANRHNKDYPLFPMMFVSIACGAISGFHGTQSPIMSRCCTNERQGRWIFYGAMVAEGILALIWAAAAGTYFTDYAPGMDGIAGLQAYAKDLVTPEMPKPNTPAFVIDVISRNWLGTVGGILAIIGVIAAPITSGDTALRSARLIVADFLHLDQRPIPKRLVIALPLFLCVFGMVFVDFEVVWRYFAWTNQTLAVFTLWAGAVWLYKKANSQQPTANSRYGYLIALVPALFMTMVCSSYIFIAEEGFNLAPQNRWIGYTVAAVITLSCLITFIHWTKKQQPK